MGLNNKEQNAPSHPLETTRLIKPEWWLWQLGEVGSMKIASSLKINHGSACKTIYNKMDFNKICTQSVLKKLLKNTISFLWKPVDTYSTVTMKKPNRFRWKSSWGWNVGWLFRARIKTSEYGVQTPWMIKEIKHDGDIGEKILLTVFLSANEHSLEKYERKKS